MDEKNLERAEQRELCKRLVGINLLTREQARQLLAQQPADFLAALEQAGIKKRLIDSMMAQMADAGYQRTIVEPIAGPNDETVTHIPGQASENKGPDSIYLEIEPGATGTVNPGIPITAVEDSIHTVPPPRRPKEAPVNLEKLIKTHSFEQGRELGRGAMGVVYRARQTDIDSNDVVVKKLIYVNPNSVARFMREARLMRLAKHPGVPSVFEIGIDKADGKPYMAMELVRGEKLSTIIDDASLNRTELLDVFVKMCDTMAYAHSQGIIHRDLKPDNVMIGKFGEAQVLDWGLAKQINQPDIPGERKSDNPKLTQEGATPGTPLYMSPEQIYSDPAEKRSDIYTLGAILYEMLTGTYIRDGSNAVEMMSRAIRDEFTVKSPRKLDPTIPPELEAIVMKALEPELENRYQTAEELRDDVQAFIRGDFVSAYKYGKLQRAWRRASKHPKKLAVAATLMLAAAVGGPAFGKVSASAARAREEAATAELGKTKAEADAQKAGKEKAELEAKQNEKYKNRVLATQSYRKAEAALKRGQNLEIVLQYLDEARKIDPEWSNPFYLTGEIYNELQRHDKAIQAFESANRLTIAESGELDVAALYSAATAAIEKEGAPEIVGNYLSQILEKAKNKDDPYVLLAGSVQFLNHAKNEKDAEKINALVEAAIKNAQKATEHRLSEAFFLLAMYHSWGISSGFNHSVLRPVQDYEKALNYVNRALALDNRKWRYFFHRSRLNERLKKYDESIADADTIIQKNTVGIEAAHFAKASALQGKASQASKENVREALGRALDELVLAERKLGKFSYADTYALRGIIHYDLNDNEKAESDLTRALEISESSQTLYWRGLVRKRNGRLQEAIDDFTKTIQLLPEARTYINRGNCYEMLSDVDLALADYLEGVNRKEPAAHFHVGRIFMQKGDNDKAMYHLETYVQSGHKAFVSQAQQILDKLRQR
ncbi:MAG TPA: protein kinase [Candidatus Nanoarchaeia archaeon]|nr:protein kinase [Candidatus Nanoarchaeia archaeon]